MIAKKIINNIESYIMITFGLFLSALGWTAFLLPAKIIGGGVSGIGSVIYFASGFPVGFSILIINAILVLLAIRILGATFGVKTIISISIMSGLFMILQYFIKEPIVHDNLMAALIGGGLSGAGVGIAIANGGNSGGTDIIALIITKYRNVSPGKVLLYLDFFIIASSFFIFRSIEKIVYGYVSMGVVSYCIDMIITGSRQTYQIMIFSEQREDIAERIVNEIGRGVTSIKGRGWYTKADTEVLMILAHKYDKPRILKIVHECDKKAFVSVAKVQGVYGLNFDKIKI